MESPKLEFQRRASRLAGLKPCAVTHEESNPIIGVVEWSVTPYIIEHDANVYVMHYRRYATQQKAKDAGYWLALDAAERLQRGELQGFD